MKKVLLLAVAAMLVFGVSAFAAETQTKAMHKVDHVKGTITAWDDATRTFTVKDKDGKEWSFQWNEKAKVHGTPKVGEMVKLNFTKDEGGKMWAEQVFVGKEEIDKSKGAKKE